VFALEHDVFTFEREKNVSFEPLPNKLHSKCDRLQLDVSVDDFTLMNKRYSIQELFQHTRGTPFCVRHAGM
jgi:hypothetical protein